jgi:hypothetical protein
MKLSIVVSILIILFLFLGCLGTKTRPTQLNKRDIRYTESCH